MSALVAIRIASWCSRSGSKRFEASSSVATCSASRRRIASGWRPGAASARAASAAISSRRPSPGSPQGLALVAAHRGKLGQGLLEAGDHRRLGGASVVLAFVLVEDFDDTLE